MDSDSDEETAAGGRLPASPVLGPKDLNAQGAGPLGAARKPAERHHPVLHIDLTDEPDSDLVCLVGRGASFALAVAILPLMQLTRSGVDCSPSAESES